MLPISSNTNDPWPASLISLLERQQELVDQLDALAQQQARHIEDSATDLLMNLLSQRQTVIDEFSSSQNELGRLTQGMDERLQRATAEQRERIKSLIADIGDRLATVMRRDEQDQASLRNNREAIKQEMLALGTARQARGAYAGPRPDPSKYADRRG